DVADAEVKIACPVTSLWGSLESRSGPLSDLFSEGPTISSPSLCPCPGVIPALGAEQVLQTLAGFKEYATTGTLLVLELVGTFVFALSGATAGVKHRLDLFGVLVVSFATATAGGI